MDSYISYTCIYVKPTLFNNVTCDTCWTRAVFRVIYHCSRTTVFYTTCIYIYNIPNTYNLEVYTYLQPVPLYDYRLINFFPLFVIDKYSLELLNTNFVEIVHNRLRTTTSSLFKQVRNIWWTLNLRSSILLIKIS